MWTWVRWNVCRLLNIHLYCKRKLCSSNLTKKYICYCRLTGFMKVFFYCYYALTYSRTLTGQNERQRRRNLYSRTHNNRNDNNANNVQNEEVILRDTFKCTWNVIPKVFCSYDCGLMDLECRFCNAKHFESEVTLGDRTAFTSCCHKGKAILPPLSQNEYFKSYFKWTFNKK